MQQELAALPTRQRCGSCKQNRDTEAFSPSYRGKVGTWCRVCFAAYNRGEQLPARHHSSRTCTTCGSEYVPVQLKAAAAFCSRTCKDKAKAARLQAAINATKSVRSCVHCGTDIGQDRRADAKFCSAECNSKAHALRRKLRARGGFAEEPGYLRLTIAERDNWTCGICADPVDPALGHPDPLCASLDHVVPVSHGGSSDPDNLRLTHLVCNLRRGNRTPLAA